MNTISDDEKISELWLHWARMPAWSHHETSALVAGIIPSGKWTYDGLRRGLYSFGKETNTRYLRIRELLHREVSLRQISFPIELSVLWDWSQRTQIQFSGSFETALIHLNRLPLASEISPDVAHSREEASTDELGVRERDTFLYIIGTMAVSKYGYTPKKRNNAAAQILKDMENIDREHLSLDTIRNKLKAASELIPQSYFSKSDKER